jgi:YidC/Oxa1 family membrane protein insertase
MTQEPNIGSERVAFLENDFIKAELTTLGGAIKTVALKKHLALGENPVILNIGGPLPILNLRGWTGAYGLSGYQLESQTSNSVTMVKTLTPTMRLQRVYTLTGDYTIELAQTVFNTGTKMEVLSPYSLDLGSATPVYTKGTERTLMGLSWMSMGGNYSTHKIHEFDAANVPLLGIQLWAGKLLVESKLEDEINWAAIKSQFFVMIVNPVDFAAKKVEGTRRFYPELRDKNQAIPDGVVASMSIPGVQVEPNASYTQKFDVYAGPKENSRLALMSDNQAHVMEFGMFSVVSRFLLWVLNHINDIVQSYGWSIVILTILLKGVLWYPQGMANKSMKRMATVAPVMKEVQDKYKDKPEKLNEEMIRTYKDYGVNPVGGCLPMLLQFPIFLGFYSMLQTTTELRHQSFFWIQDLAQPDTVFTIPMFGYDFPVNPMPLIMAASMYWSMHVTPQPAGVNNPMLKVMKFMPLMFLAFCYNFSAALSLYWTVQNIVTILQLYYNLHFQNEITLEQMKAEVAAKKKNQKKKKS